VTPDSTISEHPPSFDDFHTVVCCTASRRVDAPDAADAAYIQGAGDDSEGWARGLTPGLFWANYEDLLETEGDEALALMMERLVKTTRSRRDAGGGGATLIKPTRGFHVGALEDIQAAGMEKYDCVMVCSDMALEWLDERWGKKVLHLNCGAGKLGSRDLRRELSKVAGFITARVPAAKTGPAILVACPSGRDLAVGVALAVLCLFFDRDGTFSTSPTVGSQLGLAVLYATHSSRTGLMSDQVATSASSTTRRSISSSSASALAGSSRPDRTPIRAGQRCSP